MTTTTVSIPTAMVERAADAFCREIGTHLPSAGDPSRVQQELRKLYLAAARGVLEAALTNCRVVVEHRVTYGPEVFDHPYRNPSGRSTGGWSDAPVDQVLAQATGYLDPSLDRRLRIHTDHEAAPC